MVTEQTSDRHTSAGARTIIAVAAGNLMEWYDFGLYAFLVSRAGSSF